jgi:hypothetical protein
MLRFIFSLSLFLSFALGASYTMAQDTLTDPADFMPPKEESKVPKKDLSDLPDEYIAEATQFGENCKNDPNLSQYFNCQCMAVEYLDTRKKLGPNASSSIIRSYLGGKCKDGTELAGPMYEECLDTRTHAPTHVDPEVYCTCFTNSFIKMFEELQGAMSSQIEIAMRSRARTECSEPETARRIYGTR